MLAYALTTSSLAGRILTSVICMFSPRSPLPLGVCDFLQRPRLLNVPSEKGDNSAGTCDSDREPDDASQRPTESIFLPHRDQAKTTQVRPRNRISHRLKAIIMRWCCTRPTWSWSASVSLPSARLIASYQDLGVVEFPYQLLPAAVL